MGGERTDGESSWGVDTSKKIPSRKLAIRIWSSEERVGPKIINLDHLFILAFKAVIMKEITYFKKKKRVEGGEKAALHQNQRSSILQRW